MKKILPFTFDILHPRQSRRGFTLIEVLVVISIIGVLMSLLLVSYQSARKTARDGKRKADLEQIRSALEMCRADTNKYPTSIYEGITESIICEGTTYLQTTPKDPATNERYYYNRETELTYTLCAHLETDSSGDCGSASCGSSGTCNYKVVNP